MYVAPTLEVSARTVTAPGQVTLKSNGTVANQCDTYHASSVAFYAGAYMLNVDQEPPFEFTWSLIPGQLGVPASGSKEIELHAVTNIQGLTPAYPVIPLQVTVTNP